MKTSTKLGMMVAAVVLGGALVAGTVPALAETEANDQGNGFGKSLGATAERFTRHGMQSKADLLGTTSDELAERMQTQTFSEILEQEGVSMEDFRAKRNAEIAQRWEERGLSEEEIAARMEQLEARRGECDGSNRAQGSPFGKGMNR